MINFMIYSLICNLSPLMIMIVLFFLYIKTRSSSLVCNAQLGLIRYNVDRYASDISDHYYYVPTFQKSKGNCV